jgi:hypothetical protein
VHAAGAVMSTADGAWVCVCRRPRVCDGEGGHAVHGGFAGGAPPRRADALQALLRVRPGQGAAQDVSQPHRGGAAPPLQQPPPSGLIPVKEIPYVALRFWRWLCLRCCRRCFAGVRQCPVPLSGRLVLFLASAMSLRTACTFHAAGGVAALGRIPTLQPPGALHALQVGGGAVLQQRMGERSLCDGDVSYCWEELGAAGAAVPGDAARRQVQQTGDSRGVGAVALAGLRARLWCRCADQSPMTNARASLALFAVNVIQLLAWLEASATDGSSQVTWADLDTARAQFFGATTLLASIIYKNLHAERKCSKGKRPLPHNCTVAHSSWTNPVPLPPPIYARSQRQTKPPPQSSTQDSGQKTECGLPSWQQPRTAPLARQCWYTSAGKRARYRSTGPLMAWGAAGA